MIAAWLLPGLLAGLLGAAAWPAAGAEPKPKPASAADNAATTAKIKTALLGDKTAPGLKINVDTNAGVVTLSGQVDNAAQKTRAEQIAKQTKGVTRVINHLTIKPNIPGNRGAGEVVNDASITTKVKAALLADKTAPGLKINVDTKLGVVTLSGQVDTDAQKKRAEQIAGQTKGVKKVINQLTLKPRTPG